MELLSAFDQSNCGMAEARQLPIEHPKDYDPRTGDTPWATTACALISTEIFRQLNGFDSETFFLYCDDVDFSWRVRLAGRRVLFQPSSVVFHDKRLNIDGSWKPSSAERYYSIEASLLMAYKYSRPDRLNEVLAVCDKYASDEVFARAASNFRSREKIGKLPAQIDPEHKVSEFYNDNYCRHRFVI